MIRALIVKWGFLAVAVAILSAGSALSAQRPLARVAEVEDHLTAKARDYLTSIIAGQPYSVLVHVQPRSQSVQDKASEPSDAALAFMPLGPRAREQANIWTGKDASVESLLEQVGMIEVDLLLPGALPEDQVAAIRKGIASRLGIRESRDKLNVSKHFWSPVSKKEEGASPVNREDLSWRWVVLAGFLVMIGSFWLLSWRGVARLVQGMRQASAARPHADWPSMPMQVPATPVVAEGPAPRSSRVEAESAELSEGLKKQVGALADLFSSPGSDLMAILEEGGAKNPTAMGRVLTLLDPQALGELYQYGSGDWWHEALTGRMSGSFSEAAAITERISRLRVERRLKGPNVSGNGSERELSLALNRLSQDELLVLFSGASFEEAAPALRLVRVEASVPVARKLFPANWQEVFELSGRATLSGARASEFREKALATKPLRDPGDLPLLFKEAELLGYLEVAEPEIEREVYERLPQNSILARARRPFYPVLEMSSDEVLNLDVSPQDWAMALSRVGRDDRIRFMRAFTERQRILIEEFHERLQRDYSENGVSDNAIREARARILSHAARLKENAQERAATDVDGQLRKSA